jgi:hypothetical protein
MANEKPVGENKTTYVPVTYEQCEHIEGPFFHGTKSALVTGDELVPGYGSNFQQGRVSNNIYFTALVDTAAWGAQLKPWSLSKARPSSIRFRSSAA